MKLVMDFKFNFDNVSNISKRNTFVCTHNVIVRVCNSHSSNEFCRFFALFKKGMRFATLEQYLPFIPFFKQVAA